MPDSEMKSKSVRREPTAAGDGSPRFLSLFTMPAPAGVAHIQGKKDFQQISLIKSSIPGYT
jgi:hypothetical protein